MKTKKRFIELSESVSELTVKSAFIGASKNMYIIEEQFYTLKQIPLYQYLNYLSQLAFCVELGLKNIIKITNKVWKSHNLEELFIEADKETNNNFSKKFFGSYKTEFKQEFLSLINNVKYLYEEARYSYGSSLNHFFHVQYIVQNDIVNFCKIIDKNKPIRMLKLFLEELGEYHNFVHKNSIKINENKNIDDSISDIIKTKFEIQENIYIEEK
jgi:predicted nuclease of restriction endonuclease-like (RecB) superfamily